MPQLNPVNFAPQLVWLAITFVLLYLVLAHIALPRVERILGLRRSRIGSDLEQAREAQRQSEQLMKRYEADIAAARVQAQATIRASREKLETELNQKRAALDRQIAEKIAETEKNVQGLLDRAAGEMEAMTAGVVNDIVKQFAGVDVSDAEVRAAIRQNLKE